MHTSHLGPLRAAQKIFDAWCRHNNVQVIKPTQFTIQETTRAKAGKLIVYEGFREKLETPREIVVTNKATNTQHTIQYAYRSKICAYREGGKAKTGATAVATKTSASATKAKAKATAKKVVVGNKKKATATTPKAATKTHATKSKAKTAAAKPAKKLIAKATKVTAATAAAKGGAKAKAKKSKPAVTKAKPAAITVSLS